MQIILLSLIAGILVTDFISRNIDLEEDLVWFYTALLIVLVIIASAIMFGLSYGIHKLLPDIT